MSVENTLTCFKTYDVRGKLGEEIDEQIAYRIGRATVCALSATSVVVGYDIRETSPVFARAVAAGICDAGADVLKIGFAGTEQMYSAVSEFDACAGIEVTASHNPIDYNGMKIVKKGSQPLTSQEFADIKRFAEENNFFDPQQIGKIKDIKRHALEKYINKITSFVDLDNLEPFKIVINSGNGAAGPVVDALNDKFKKRGIEAGFFFLHHDPDPMFPNGIPNPMLEENRTVTSNTVTSQQADFGIAFDGDFDRCFFFDNFGSFVPSEYIVGLLARLFLKKELNAKIVHDNRIIWNTLDVVSEGRGEAIASKTGHAFVKKTMRDYSCIYGGEMSAHHYFRDFYYCDSGIITWLLIWELLSKVKISLSDLVSESKRRFPSSGEINFVVNDPENCMQVIKKLFKASASSISETDGLSITFETWRFNLRKSNTEPLVRLNLETRADVQLLKQKIKELTGIISSL